MPVRKYRSVAEMPGVRPLPPLDPENLRIACELTELARALHPWRFEPGVRKFRSIDEAFEHRKAWEKLQVRQRTDLASSTLNRLGASQSDLADFCRRNHIRRLAFFGSVLRSDFAPRSDVDVLVEFEPGHTPGLEFVAMRDELTRMLGRSVDLNTRKSLSRHFRDEVLREAELAYAAA